MDIVHGKRTWFSAGKMLFCFHDDRRTSSSCCFVAEKSEISHRPILHDKSPDR